MQTTITITQQWQIYIPQAVRKALKLKPTSHLKAQVKNHQLIITPEENPILKLAGKYKHLKPKKPLDLDNVRDYIDYSDL